jgi:hypothetical protein
VLNAFSRAVWIESATGVAIAATRVEGMDNQKQLPSAEAITEDLKTVSDTITENTGGAGSSQSGRDDVDSLANAPQGSDDDQMGLARWWPSLLSGSRLAMNCPLIYST